MNHDTVSRAAATVVLVDRPDEARDPALAEDERRFSIVGGDHRPVPSFETGACVATPVVAQLAIAFAAEHSSGTDAAGPLLRRQLDRPGRGGADDRIRELRSFRRSLRS